jgi:hypothetical protein
MFMPRLYPQSSMKYPLRADGEREIGNFRFIFGFGTFPRHEGTLGAGNVETPVRSLPGNPRKVTMTTPTHRPVSQGRCGDVHG